MPLSSEAMKSIKKAQKVQKRRKNKHWFFLRKDDSNKEIISKLFTQLMAVVLLVCAVVLFDYFKASFDNMKLSGNLQSLYGTVTDALAGDGKLLTNAEELLKINPDTAGWVRIAETKVDVPVVLKKDDDINKPYYLTHNFNGDKAKAGTVFIDQRTTLTSRRRSQNLVLYGHNERDNTMFGDLDKYKSKLDFYKLHPVIQFNSNYEMSDYKIISYFVTNVLPSQAKDGVVFDYHNYIDMDKARAQDFIDNVLLRSEIITNVDVKPGDEFITLSTCSSEFEPSRFVVVARKVRKGEDSTVDTSSATVNKDAKVPDWDTIYGK